MKTYKTAKRNVPKIFVVVLFLLFAVGESHAVTYYVSPAGSDSSGGLIGAPFKTIQKAADIVNPGDTVIVKDGTYTNYWTRNDGSKVFAQFTRGGTAGNWVTFKSENKWGAKFDGQNNTVAFGFAVLANYIRIEDFEMYGMQNASVWINSFSPPLNNIYIYGNKIHDMGRGCCDTNCQNGTDVPGGSGIYTGSLSSYITVDSNIIYGIGLYDHITCGVPYSSHNYSHDHGIYSRSDYLVAENNVMWDTNAGFGIASCGTNPVIVNNTFVGNSPYRDPTVSGHIDITNNDGVWPHSNYPVGPVVIENNISYDPDHYMTLFYYATGVTSVRMRNNLVYGPGWNSMDGLLPNAILWTYAGYTTPPPNVTETGNIVGSTSSYDPKFTNIATKDYTLQAGSPAIGLGINDSNTPAVDADAIERVNPTAVGAYEYGGSGTPPPPPPLPTDATLPSVPTGLTASAVSSFQINLSWKASSDNVGIAGYKVYGGISTTPRYTTATNFSDNGLAASTFYTYTVAAYDVSYNVSGQSAAASARTTTLQRYTLTASKVGAGTGTVSSYPAGINCGTNCTGVYDAGSLVTLTALPDATSTFGGWSGGGCVGTGRCVVTTNGNISVTATFNILPPPPVANFTGSPLSGEAPLNVNFIDTSSHPSSWYWSFYDGYTSSKQNPSHVFRTPRTYAIFLSVSNESGTDTLTKTDYITVSSCPNQPIRIAPVNPKDSYASLQEAYNLATDGDTIQVQAFAFSGDLNLNRNIAITLKGGYDCGYTTNFPSTIISGSLTIGNGTVTVEDIETSL